MTVFNFSAGPAVLPKEVLQRAAAEMLDWHGSGMSVMEMSHRGPEFISIADKAEADLRKLMSIGDDYEVLFLQGGAIGENAIVPMNLLGDRKTIDFVNTGEWSKKSIKEAKKYAQVNIAASSEDKNFTYVPARTRWKLSPDAAYVHVCTNETIGGIEYHWTPDVGDRAAGGRHVVAHPVAPDRRVEVRRDLRRRAEEHGPRRPDAGHRAQGSARSRAADHAVGIPLEGAGGERLDAEHAADLRDLHRGHGVRVAARAGRTGRDRAEEHREGEAAVRRARREPASTTTRCARKTARA